MIPINSGSMPATTDRVHATTGRVLGTTARVPGIIGWMREEIVAEYPRSSALHYIRPHTYFLTLKYHSRCVSHATAYSSPLNDIVW
jgi:hypothetical protein